MRIMPPARTPRLASICLCSGPAWNVTATASGVSGGSTALFLARRSPFKWWRQAPAVRHARNVTFMLDRLGDAGSTGPPANHEPRGRLIQRLFGQHRRVVGSAGAEQPALMIVGDAGGGDVGVEHFR